MSEQDAGSFLSGAPVEESGTPAEARQLSPAEQATQDAMDGPPEWLPSKYWDAEKKAARYEDLGRGYQSLEKMLGREKIPMPVNDEDQEGWNRVYKAIGRPDAADGYEFERPDLPSDLPYDEESEKNFRTWAHINGLNKKQAKNLYDGYVKTQLERHSAWHEERKKARGELENALLREHGGRIDAVKQTAFGVMKDYADPQFRQYLDETGLGNDPRMVRFLHKIGARMHGETKLKSNPMPTAQPKDLDKAIGDFREKYSKSLMDKTHPDHDRNVAEYKRLFEARYGVEAQ